MSSVEERFIMKTEKRWLGRWWTKTSRPLTVSDLCWNAWESAQKLVQDSNHFCWFLSEEERELLLLIDKSLKFQPFDGQYKATIKINDTEIVRESTSAIQARNDACLATYECLFKLRISGNDGVECISRSIETAQVSKAPSLDSCSTNKAMLTKLSPTDMESYRERIIGT